MRGAARLFGDAVYDQDHWTPQVAVGAQIKSADHKAEDQQQ